MGKRGPQPTPTAQLKARGSWRADQREGEPVPAGDTPDKPDWLDEVASDAWDVLVPMLMGMGVVGDIDANAIARYCAIYARWRKCEQLLKDHGMSMPEKDEDGNVTGFKEFPWTARASKLADQLLRLEREFGMTPSARASLAIERNREDKESNDHGSARGQALRLIGSAVG